MDRVRSSTVYQAECLRTQAEIDSMLETDNLIRRIVGMEPEDATREGFAIDGLPPGQGQLVVEELDELELLPHMEEAALNANAYGGGALVMGIDDGQEPDQPVNMAQLRAVRTLTPVDRYELVPAVYDEDLRSRNVGKPLIYQLASPTAGIGRVHRDRVVRFDGRKLPGRIRQRRLGWGASMIDLVWSAYVNLKTSTDALTAVIDRAHQDVFYTKFLADAVDAGNEDEVIARYQAMQIANGLFGAYVLDKGEEEWQTFARSLAGLGEAHDKVMQMAIAYFGQPRVLLLGESVGGINSGEESGQVRGWYDRVAVRQTNYYEPRARRVIDLVMASTEGPMNGIAPERYTVDWNPLWQLSEAEKADVRQKNSMARSVDSGGATITVEEARRDEDLVETYDLDPAAPPPQVSAAGEEEPTEEVPGLQASNEDEIPMGENLIAAREAARRLGFRSSSPVLAMARRGDFPIWKPGGRWMVAWSLVQNAVTGTRMKVGDPQLQVL